MELDNIDKRIISELEDDGRVPFLRIAKMLKVSEGTIRKRVSKLIEQGIIKRFTVELKNRSTAIVGIETNPHMPTRKIAAELKKLEAKLVFEVAGRYDLICFLHGNELSKVNDLLEKIRIIEGVVHTETFTILRED
jgi:DNA-binding Lrp family transcriptional regulator